MVQHLQASIVHSSQQRIPESSPSLAFSEIQSSIAFSLLRRELRNADLLSLSPSSSSRWIMLASVHDAAQSTKTERAARQASSAVSPPPLRFRKTAGTRTATSPRCPRAA